MGVVKQLGQGLGLIQNDAPSAEDTLALQKKANDQQLQTNLSQNRVNQVGPDGRSTWAQGPAGPNGEPGQWTQTTSLSPGNQRLYDTQQGLSQGLADASSGALSRVTTALANPLDISGAPARTNGPDASQYQVGQYSSSPVTAAQGQLATSQVGQAGTAQGQLSQGQAAQAFNNQAGFYGAGVTEAGPAASFSGASAGAGRDIQRTFDSSNVRELPGQIDDASRRRVEEAIMSRINPQYQQDEAALRSRLLNSGIEVGTDAYNREMNNFSQRLNDARMQAVLAGGTEESRQVGLTAGLNAQEFGQAQAKGDFAQRADTAMSNNETQASIASAANAANAGIASMNAKNNVNLANAGFANTASMFNAGQANNTSQFNTGQTNSMGQFNTSQANDMSKFNTGQTNDMSRFNTGQANDMTRFNTGQVNDMSRFNTTTGLQEADLNRQITGQNYQTGLAGAQFQNASRDQAINEAIGLRQQPLAELNALRTGSMPGNPTFGSYYTNGMAAGNALGATSEATAQANTQQGQLGGMLGKIGSFFL